MRVLFDTNIILDVLLDREPFAELSTKLVSHVETGQLEGYLCASTVTTLDYLLGKSIGKQQARGAIQKLLVLFQVAEVNKATLLFAGESSFADFEDTVLYFSGKLAGVEAILSRNIKDFKAAELPVYSPAELEAILSAS